MSNSQRHLRVRMEVLLSLEANKSDLLPLQNLAPQDLERALVKERNLRKSGTELSYQMSMNKIKSSLLQQVKLSHKLKSQRKNRVTSSRITREQLLFSTPNWETCLLTQRFQLQSQSIIMCAANLMIKLYQRSKAYHLSNSQSAQLYPEVQQLSLLIKLV